MTVLEQDQITEIFIGQMGIKEAYRGEELVYTRPGGYFYIDLSTTE